MRSSCLLLGVSGVLVLACVAPAPADVVARMEFEAPEVLTNCTGLKGTLSITTEAGSAHGGNGALDLSYPAAEGVGLSIQNLAVANAKSVSVWLKATARTPLLFNVAEEDGSAYEGFFALPPNQWTNLRLPLADLQLSPLTNDENAQLDVDQIRTMYFGDLSNIGGELSRALGKKDGAQHIWVDDLVFDTTELPPLVRTVDAGGAKVTTIADFHDQTLHGLLIGDTTASFVPGARQPGDDFGIQLGFTIGGWQWSGLMAPLGRAPRDGLREVRVHLSAEKDVRAALLLEEKDGSRYQTVFDVPGGGGWKQYVVRVEDLKLDASTADENGALDRSQIRLCLILVDTFNSLPDNEGIGRLGIDNLALVSQP